MEGQSTDNPDPRRSIHLVRNDPAEPSDRADTSAAGRRAGYRVLGDVEIDLADDPVGRIDDAVTVLLDDGLEGDGAPEPGSAARFRLMVDAARTSVVAIDVTREEDGWRVGVDPMNTAPAATEDLAYRATHDLLTGLANRSALMARTRIAIERAERTGLGVAVLYLDIDRFKRINDSLGHHIGDVVLVEVAKRLERVSRPTDLVARLGGDEFVILCEDIQEPRDAAVIAERVLEEIQAPLVVGDDHVELAVGTSIGIALEERQVDTAELVRRADQALLRAKERGRGRYEFHDHEQSVDTIRRLEMERQLRAAIGLEQLRLEYQPIMLTNSRLVESVEALIRWDHPQLGTLTAGEFIDVATETGLIVPIGRWVLEEACAELARWDATDQARLKMHINVSGPQLLDQSFVNAVEGALAENWIEPSRLVLEVDESVLSVRESAEMDRAITKLIHHGVDFAIDHYGRGYGSVANLGRLPVPMVKIDKSFVADIETSPQARAVIRALLDLAGAHDLTTVVEGVESMRQYQILELLGCDACQGYLLGAPMRPEQMTEWLSHSARDTA
jgi:diguanylate cyclase (GGDEF)-like protein